ncbi:MAG: lipoyl synthase [Candidatus Omnitrophica bacterium]|nr:lipoyl synthase [Candidatus Omnitrophota bacterium]
MKPQWLNKKINLGACNTMKSFLRDLKIETVCEQALCPNMGECFSSGQATFLILGRHCTRFCKFCNIDKGVPEPLDREEPARVAEATARLKLKHVVITSVTRDDLSDGGAEMFTRTVSALRSAAPACTVELLIPDFQNYSPAIQKVAQSFPEIIAHNVETVPALYSRVRQGAVYLRSLDVLRAVKEFAPRVKIKSGIMLGMGESPDEVVTVLSDLKAAGCDFLSIGQYLAPSSRHYPVQEYISPEQFDRYKETALSLGFSFVVSGPYVRSSYMAGEYVR